MLGNVPTPEHPLLAHLVDLESRFDPQGLRDYDPVDLVRYALGASDYWAELAIEWLEQGAPVAELGPDLLAVETDRKRPQPLRHRARRVRRRV